MSLFEIHREILQVIYLFCRLCVLLRFGRMSEYGFKHWIAKWGWTYISLRGACKFFGANYFIHVILIPCNIFSSLKAKLLYFLKFLFLSLLKLFLWLIPRKTVISIDYFLRLKKAKQNLFCRNNCHFVKNTFKLNIIASSRELNDLSRMGDNICFRMFVTWEKWSPDPKFTTHNPKYSSRKV